MRDSTQLPWGDLQLAIWTKPDTTPTPPRTVSHPPPPLPGAPPPGYEAVVDSNSGLTYYANRVTGHSTWNERDCAPPTVYESFVDPKSGNTYYANWATGHSVWTMRECLPQGEQIPMAATAQQEHNVAAVATRGRWRRPIANGPTLQLPGATAPAHVGEVALMPMPAAPILRQPDAIIAVVADIFEQAALAQAAPVGWNKLPGGHLNSILFERASRPEDVPLVMYRCQPQMSVWFHSGWNGDRIQLKDYETIIPCPRCHWWVWCIRCEKFLLPAEEHRASKSHQNRVDRYIEFKGRERCYEEMERTSGARFYLKESV